MSESSPLSSLIQSRRFCAALRWARCGECRSSRASITMRISREQVRELTSQDAYDIIHIEFPFLTPYLAAVSPQSRAKKILSMHNIESIRFERELRYSERNSRRLVIQWDRLFFKRWEQQAMRQFDGITAVSELGKSVDSPARAGSASGACP